jgi:PIN domain nuclease of toxin-antitoxin system
MQQYVTDTQCLLWHMGDQRRLPKAVQRIFASTVEGRSQILVPSIVLVETVFLLQRQRVKEEVLNQVMQITEQPNANYYVTPLNLAVVQALRSFGPASIPELSDRIIAATALALQLPLLTTDMAIADSGLVETIG